MEDLSNYKFRDNGIILQDSYFALRSYALMKQKYPDTLAKEVYKLLQLFPKPEFGFYLTASTEERLRRNEKRNKPIAYMEKLLLSNPKEFEMIEKNLKDITTSLFDVEVINTQDKKPNEIALYIESKIKERNRGDDVYERE
jgi:thymidylate kinase